MSFRNWSSLQPPLSQRRKPRQPGIQSDKLAADRSLILRESVARDYRCDRCSHRANHLHHVGTSLVCTDCRDAG